MKIVVRADASVRMGTGHVMRCRTLANALQRTGAQVHFITRAHSGHLGDMLARDGFAVTLLPESTGFDKEGNDYAAWLGISQQEDASQTISALGNHHCDWLIVDHYGLDRVWEEQLRPYAHNLMVIDDLANRAHDCDLLLDQNYTIRGKERYQNWVPEHCQLLLGPRYALLRPEYAQHRETMMPRTGTIQRVLVYMGGADNANITSKVLAALTDRLAHLDVDVVIAANCPHKDEVLSQATIRPNINVIDPHPHLADLMVKADLAIGAGGGAMWERMCLGLPSLVLSIAENQVPACEALSSTKLIHYLGAACEICSKDIERSIIELLADEEQLRASATRAQSLVDGQGASRVAEAVIPTSTTGLKVRPANARDALTFFAWANDPVVRSSAINSSQINMETHLRWFESRLKDVNSHLYVLVARGVPVGQVRFEQHDAEMTIDYSLDEVVRGRGWAKQLLKLGMEAINVSQLTQFKALVKPENFVSATVFSRLGFVEQSIDSVGNRLFQLSANDFHRKKKVVS